MADAIHVEIERLKKEDISDDELKMIKTRTKANLIRGLGDNEGLATQLAIYQTRYGDWRELFRSVDRIDKVTKADIRRVANETFNDTNRTVGVIETITGPTGEQGSDRGASNHDPSDHSRSSIRSSDRRVREVRNEKATARLLDGSHGRCDLRASFNSRGASRELEADPHPASARFPSPAAETH